MLRSECPNPQFSRDGIVVLNGKWKFSSRYVPEATEINVPFAPESELSGICHKGFIPECEYSRSFSASKPSEHERLFLHFGAVNYEARVYINGACVGEHRGGYTPFAFDISGFVTDGENEITVKVRNDVRANVPTGKQSEAEASHGCFYSRVTGIWQPAANCIGISLKVGNATEQTNAWSPLPCIHVGNLADFSGDDNGVKSLHLWKVDGDHPCAVEGCSSYERWIGTNPDTSIYANGTWHIDGTTKKIVVSNETANSLFAAMQA